MMELKWNLSLAAYLWARKTYLQGKRRYLRARRVHGFLDSVVVVLFNLICSEVDVLILYLSFEIRETTNKILSFIALIPLKSLLLPSGSRFVSCFSTRAEIPFQLDEIIFRFSGPLGRAENPSPVFANRARMFCPVFKNRARIFSPARRARIFSPGWVPLHVIGNLILRRFVSEAGLKLQPGQPSWNYSPSWHSPCNQALNLNRTSGITVVMTTTRWASFSFFYDTVFWWEV